MSIILFSEFFFSLFRIFWNAFGSSHEKNWSKTTFLVENSVSPRNLWWNFCQKKKIYRKIVLAELLEHCASYGSKKPNLATFEVGGGRTPLVETLRGDLRRFPRSGLTSHSARQIFVHEGVFSSPALNNESIYPGENSRIDSRHAQF